jgi:hypothetical protein
MEFRHTKNFVMNLSPTVKRAALALLVYLSAGFLLGWLVFWDFGVFMVVGDRGAVMRWSNLRIDNFLDQSLEIAAPAAMFGLPIAFVAWLPACVAGFRRAMFYIQGLFTAVLAVLMIVLFRSEPSIVSATALVTTAIVNQIPFVLAACLLKP